jgi:hypothetical protein
MHRRFFGDYIMIGFDSKQYRVTKFLAPFTPWHDDFSPFKFMLWLILGFCVFTTALLIRAVIALALSGAASEPLWPW